MGKVVSQMRFDEFLYEKTKAIAANEFRSINSQIEYFIKRGIEAYEAEHGPIQLEKKK